MKKIKKMRKPINLGLNPNISHNNCVSEAERYIEKYTGLTGQNHQNKEEIKCICHLMLYQDGCSWFDCSCNTGSFWTMALCSGVWYAIPENA